MHKKGEEICIALFGNVENNYNEEKYVTGGYITFESKYGIELA